MPKLKPIALLSQYACYVIGYDWRAARGLEGQPELTAAGFPIAR